MIFLNLLFKVFAAQGPEKPVRKGTGFESKEPLNSCFPDFHLIFSRELLKTPLPAGRVQTARPLAVSPAGVYPAGPGAVRSSPSGKKGELKTLSSKILLPLPPSLCRSLRSAREVRQAGNSARGRLKPGSLKVFSEEKNDGGKEKAAVTGHLRELPALSLPPGSARISPLPVRRKPDKVKGRKEEFLLSRGEKSPVKVKPGVPAGRRTSPALSAGTSVPVAGKKPSDVRPARSSRFSDRFPHHPCGESSSGFKAVVGEGKAGERPEVELPTRALHFFPGKDEKGGRVVVFNGFNGKAVTGAGKEKRERKTFPHLSSVRADTEGDFSVRLNEIVEPDNSRQPETSGIKVDLGLHSQELNRKNPTHHENGEVRVSAPVPSAQEHHFQGHGDFQRGGEESSFSGSAHRELPLPRQGGNHFHSLVVKSGEVALRLSLSRSGVMNLTLQLPETFVAGPYLAQEIRSIIRSSGFTPGKVYLKVKGRSETREKVTELRV